ncbi:MAG: S-adenosyl-l-methionine hydroxide adenosyltransferase family protein [Anaerolineaceae bacterium]
MSHLVITLTTDFGLSDFDAGVLSGVIWSIAPQAKITELTHAITPFNVLEGAVVLGRCTPFFPAGSIHVAVVDPGVGTKRRGLAARLGKQLFVGPDNGLCTLMVRQAADENKTCEFYALDRPKYWLPDVTHVFHGRDIFAPAAAHLAAGLPIEEIGSRINDPILLDIPAPVQTENGWRGTILHVDHFGNLTSNLTLKHLDGKPKIELRIMNAVISGIHTTYGSASAGQLIALIDDSCCLEIAVSQGSAEHLLEVGVGSTFEVVFKE